MTIYPAKLTDAPVASGVRPVHMHITELSGQGIWAEREVSSGEQEHVACEMLEDNDKVGGHSRGCN